MNNDVHELTNGRTDRRDVGNSILDNKTRGTLVHKRGLGFSLGLSLEPRCLFWGLSLGLG